MSVELREPVNVLLLAMAAAELIRESVDKIDAKILAENDFGWNTFDGKLDPATEYSTPFCRESRLTYLMDEESMAKYETLRQEAIEASEWWVANPEYCPALSAEFRVTQLENAVLRKAGELLQTPQMTQIYGAKRKKGLDLLIGMVTSYPGFVPPSPEQIRAEIAKVTKRGRSCQHSA